MLVYMIIKAMMLCLGMNGPVMSEINIDMPVAIAAPDYAQWGRLAMEETAKAYRGADIVDYKHEGRFRISQDREEERFILWLRETNREFGVRVTVSLLTNPERLHSVHIAEISPGRQQQ